MALSKTLSGASGEESTRGFSASASRERDDEISMFCAPCVQPAGISEGYVAWILGII